MDTYRILIVDDEAAVRESLRKGLEDEGWEVAEAASRAQMFDQLSAHRFDLVTLDLMLGEDDGLELARELRGQWNLPVVMITGKTQPLDRVAGLDRGADDYIVKPFHIREVVVRIRRTLHRYRAAPLSDGQLVFDHSAYDLRNGVILHRDGSQVDLTGIERQIFELLATHPGRIFSRDDISQTLHGRDWSPFDRTIDGHVARLRRKIEPPGEAPVLIRSVRGVGYVFAGKVSHPDAAG